MSVIVVAPLWPHLRTCNLEKLIYRRGGKTQRGTNSALLQGYDMLAILPMSAGSPTPKMPMMIQPRTLRGRLLPGLGYGLWATLFDPCGEGPKGPRGSCGASLAPLPPFGSDLALPPPHTSPGLNTSSMQGVPSCESTTSGREVPRLEFECRTCLSQPSPSLSLLTHTAYMQQQRTANRVGEIKQILQATLVVVSRLQAAPGGARPGKVARDTDFDDIARNQLGRYPNGSPESARPVRDLQHRFPSRHWSR